MARSETAGPDLSALSRDELEAALRSALARAEEAEGVERAFLFAMSHELKTPLNAILGFTDAMQRGLSGPLTDMQRRQLASVERSAQRLLGLIGDVLDLTKALSGELELSQEEFDLGIVAARTAEEFRGEAESRGLAFSVSSPEGSYALGDHRRLQQALRNLLSNALKFTERGSVSVSVAPSPTLRPGEPQWLRVTVADSGIGIEAASLDSIWKPFAQLDSGRTRRYEGAGIGLTLARLLVEAMGGSIMAESAVGSGSRFSIELPTSGRNL